MREKRKDAAYAVLCTVVYMIILGLAVPFVYGIVDDRSMMEIVSGQYLGVPEAHTFFLGYWYSLYLTGMYRLQPAVDWYALSFLLFQGMCLSLILYRCIRRQKAALRKITAVLVLLLFLITGAQALTQLTFTTTAAVLGVTAVFWYMTSENFGKTDFVIVLILCFLTRQTRTEIFYMVLAVCAVLWIFRSIQGKKESLWHRMIPVGVAGVLFFVSAGEAVGYGSAEWKAYREYEHNRTMVYDYPDYTLPFYEGAEEFYASVGIEKKSRARTLMNYNYTADDRITALFFQEYVEAHDRAFPPEGLTAGRLVRSVKEYGKGVLSGRFHGQHILALVLYAFLTVWYLRRKEMGACFRIVCILGVQMLLWLYLLYAGRFPQRVIYSMDLMLTMTALLFAGEALRGCGLPEKTYRTGLGVVCLLLCIPAALWLWAHRQQNQEQYRRNEAVEELKNYCMEHPDHFYFNDVTSMAFSTYNVHLWRRESYYMNYMSLGDWMSFSPVWEKKLEQNGIESAGEALYEQENVYLICSFDKGLEYLISLYDGVTCTEVDKISGFHIYDLSRAVEIGDGH